MIITSAVACHLHACAGPCDPEDKAQSGISACSWPARTGVDQNGTFAVEKGRKPDEQTCAHWDLHGTRKFLLNTEPECNGYNTEA